MNQSYYEPECDPREGFMQSQRERGLKSIAKGLNINICTDEIATCIAFAYREGVEDARNLMNNLFLSQSDIFAILDDEENFWDAIAEEGYSDD